LLHLSVSLAALASERLTTAGTLVTIGSRQQILYAFLTVPATNRSKLTYTQTGRQKITQIYKNDCRVNKDNIWVTLLFH